VPLKEPCVVFIIEKHNTVVFSFDVLFGLTWRMLTPCYDYEQVMRHGVDGFHRPVGNPKRKV
jgi:hypothetical protein